MRDGPDRFVMIVRNPRARHAPSLRAIWEGAAPLRRGRWRVEVADTHAAGDATALTQQAAERGASVVVACGGDGTLNEVLNGLSGRATALAVLPAGTANVWSREASIPRDPVRALALLDEGRRVRVDVGVASIGAQPSRRFLLMCGVGLDADAVREVEEHPRLKRLLRQAAFAWPAARAIASAHPVRVNIASDDVNAAPQDIVLAVAGNTRLYGGVARIAGEARIDDGLLDLVTFEGDVSGWRAPLRYSVAASRALRGVTAGTDAPGVTYRRSPGWELTPERPLPVQVDGEYLGEAGPEAPLRLAALPEAIEVVIGRQPNALLGEPA
ncbi:MAG: YegS/Rv2252/BmrU family lipid kinase [Dehalococcoidia bacterium]|nr:YegS/Rv2252/BmrU family lipid kinase [Dehalococcoidia bacterium]